MGCTLLYLQTIDNKLCSVCLSFPQDKGKPVFWWHFPMCLSVHLTGSFQAVLVPLLWQRVASIFESDIRIILYRELGVRV